MKNKITEISVSRYIKLSLPNYSSDQVGASITMEVGEDHQEAFKEAYSLLDDKIKSEIDRLGYTYIYGKLMEKSKDPDPDWIKKGFGE